MPTAVAVARRSQTPEDDAFLAELYTATHADELAVTGWDAATVAAFCAQQRAARERWYAAAFPGACAQVLVADGEPLGRLLTHRQAGITYVVDIAVAPSRQGRGIGTAVLHAVLDEAGGPVRLTVRRDNPARRLYERLGFVAVADDGLDLVLEAAR